MNRGAAIWRTRDGTMIRIADMTDSHLLNAIRWLRRTHQRRCWALAMSADVYASSAPDGAADAASQAAEEFYELAEAPYGLDSPWAEERTLDEAVTELVPEHAALLREAKRRKLDVS